MFCHEDVNGEKLTVKERWIFGADFSRFTQSFSRFIRDINGEKKHLLIDDLFHGWLFTVYPSILRQDYLRKTYWEHGEKKACREPLRARNSN